MRAFLLPPPPQPVGLLPPPIAPTVKLAKRRRNGGELIRAALLNRGIRLDRIVRHKDGTFTGAVFNYRLAPIADQVAVQLASTLRNAGLVVFKHGVDYYTGLMFGGTRTPMVSFALNHEDIPNVWTPEKWTSFRIQPAA